MKALLFIISLLGSLCAHVAADTENYLVFAAAAAASGISIKSNRRYSMYEYWHSTSSYNDCIPGWSHVRVIYGKVAKRGGEKDFVAKAFDIVRNSDNKINMEIEEWRANHYVKNQQWVRVSQDSQYSGVHLVQTGMSDNHIRDIGKSLHFVS